MVTQLVLGLLTVRRLGTNAPTTLSAKFLSFCVALSSRLVRRKSRLQMERTSKVHRD